MEYRVDTFGPVHEDEVLQAVKQFLKTAPGGLPRGFFPQHHPYIVPPPVAKPGGPPLPFRQPGYMQFIPVSEWGGITQYYFVFRSRVLTINPQSWHRQWTHVGINWHRGLQIPALGPIVVTDTRAGDKPVSQMTDAEKLRLAIERALPKVPAQAQQFVEELLTPANIAIFVTITTALMVSGVGEVLGLGFLVVGGLAGGLDFCVNVLRLLFEFYRKATGARTMADIDQAADLFAEAVVRGGVDILDILVGRRAAAKLAGRGIRGVGAYLAYLEGELKFIWGRGGGRPLPRPPAEAPPPAEEPTPPLKPKKPVIRFGNNPNQEYHVFRHTDELGLDRAAVRVAVEDHLSGVTEQITPGKPFNQVIVVDGQKLQYTAFKLPDGSVNVGRIHGVN